MLVVPGVIFSHLIFSNQTNKIRHSSSFQVYNTTKAGNLFSANNSESKVLVANKVNKKNQDVKQSYSETTPQVVQIDSSKQQTH